MNKELAPCPFCENEDIENTGLTYTCYDCGFSCDKSHWNKISCNKWLKYPENKPDTPIYREVNPIDRGNK